MRRRCLLALTIVGCNSPSSHTPDDAAATFDGTKDVLVEDDATVEIDAQTGCVQPGTLDPSFGDHGMTPRLFLDGPAYAAAVALDSQDRLVIGGSVWSGQHGSFAVVRLLTDGTRDTTFALNGLRLFPEFESWAQDVLVLSDDRILAVGGAHINTVSVAIVARLLPDGAPDPSFGDQGIVVVAPDQGTTTGFDGSALVVDELGRIVVGIQAWDSLAPTGTFQWKLIRLSELGVLDTTFSPTNPFAPSAYVHDLALANDGAVVVAGTRLVENTPVGALGFYETDGALRGSSQFDQLSSSEVLGISVDGSHFLVAGIQGNSVGMLGKLSATGAPDPAFGTGGLVAVGQGVRFEAATSESSKPIAVGAVDSAVGEEIIVTNLLSNGSPDLGFGAAGSTRFSPARYASGNAVALQRDGKIVVAGHRIDALAPISGFDMLVARVCP